MGGDTGVFLKHGFSASTSRRDQSAAFVHLYHRMEVVDKLSFYVSVLLYGVERCFASSACRLLTLVC